MVSKRSIALGPAVLAALGIFAVLAIVLQRAVDLPFWDEWSWSNLVYGARTGTLTFAQLWAPHGDHRMLIPNLVMLALDAAGGWHVVREQIVSLVLLALTQLVCWALIRTSVPAARRGACFFATTVLLLGLGQWENLDWGFQMAWFICNLGVVVVVWAVTRPRAVPRDTLVALVAATVASLSSSQGLLAWETGLVALLLMPRRRAGTIALWIVAAIVVSAIVRSGVPAAGHSAGIKAMAHYALIYLGAPVIGSLGLRLATDAGIVLVLWFIGLCTVAARGSRRTRVRLAPWLAVGAYPFMAAIVTATGRAGFGLAQADSSRYTTIGVLAWVAAVAATCAVVPRGRGRIVAAIAPALIVVLFSVKQSLDGNHEWLRHTAERRAASAALAAHDPRIVPTLYSDERHMRAFLKELAAVHDGPFSGR
jgi:hypothetical protein